MIKRLLTCVFLLTAVFVMAQDTIVQGVIRVRKPIEPAKYHVKVANGYGDYSNNSHIDRFTSQVIVMSDSAPGRFPAQPYLLTHRDSQEVALVNGGITQYLCANYPNDAFDWNVFFSTLDYGYAWNDSTRSDSAQFRFDISSKGEVTATPMPWKNANAETKAFEKLTSDKMATLGYWFPARVMTGKKNKTKNVNSSVLVTVYAEDAMAGRLKPLTVIPK